MDKFYDPIGEHIVEVENSSSLKVATHFSKCENVFRSLICLNLSIK